MPSCKGKCKGNFAPLIELEVFPLSVLAMVQVTAAFAVADAPEVEGGTDGMPIVRPACTWSRCYTFSTVSTFLIASLSFI